jgi:CRISPR-associated endoribonuclease Cas6
MVGDPKDMESPLSHFKFAQFQFILKAIDCINLPVYKGSTFRGGFGHAFKKVVCVNREKVCDSCLLKGKCVYSYVFETPLPSNTLKMRKYPFAPHPFIITPPLEKNRDYREDERLCFEFTLIGKSIDYLPYFIYTFDELGRIGIGKGKGKYQLEEVKVIQIGERGEIQGQRTEVKGESETIYSGKEKVLCSNYRVIKIDDLNSFNLSPLILNLVFMTPTRLKFDGRLSPSLEFHILIRNLLRRISLLSYFHCDKELELNFKEIIEKSRDVKVQKEDLSWFDWERYSNRQETKMMMGGFVGSITFEGDFEPFLPFLLLGECIHVGKGTSFGLGKYEIVRT